MANLKTQLEIEGKDLASGAFKKASSSAKSLERATTSANSNISKSFKGAAVSAAKYVAAFAGISAIISVLKASKESAIENEQEAVNLKRQVEATGLSFDRYGDQINAVIQAQANYGVLTRTETSQALRSMILATNDVAVSMENLGLVQDLAAAKSSLSLASAADLVGRALQGDITMLARYIPALRIAAAELGTNATAADKSALAINLLRQRVAGAATTMDATIKSIQASSVAWEELKDAIGGVILELIGSGTAFEDALRGAEKFFLELRTIIKGDLGTQNILDLEVQLKSLQRQESSLKFLDIFPDISIFEERNNLLKNQINQNRIEQERIAARIAEIKKNAAVPEEEIGPNQLEQAEKFKETQERIAGIRQRFIGEAFQKRGEAHLEEQEQLKTHQGRLGEMWQSFGEIRLSLARAEAEQLRQIESQKIQTAQASMSAITNLANAMFIFQGQNSRKMFEAVKAFNIAQATLDAYASFNKVLADPTPMPTALRFSLAASAVAMGIANVARISATSFAGGGGGGVGGGGGGGTPLIGANPSGPQVQNQQNQPITVNMTFQSLDPSSISDNQRRKIGEDLTPIIVNAIKNGQDTGNVELVWNRN